MAYCLWSIARSARLCGVEDYEIIVSDQQKPNFRDVFVVEGSQIRWIEDDPFVAGTPHGPVEVFNKCRAINRGIEAAQGEVLTFLDCDAVVGDQFMTGAEWLGDHDATRLCYRVRYLPESFMEELTLEAPVAEAFRRYDDYPIAHEGYGAPEIPIANLSVYDTPFTFPSLIFGNSQFSIRREDLGEVRCDEEFAGPGCEDLDFIMAICRETGKRYSGAIRPDPGYNMFHIRNRREGTWADDRFNQRNVERYRKKWSARK